MKERIEYWSVSFLFFVFNLIPFRLACLLGKKIGELIFFVDRRHRRITLENLHQAFGKEKSPEEIKKIGKSVFSNMVITIVELARVQKMGMEWLEKTCSVEGFENVKRAKEKGQSILLLTAHLGNWELMALRYGMLTSLGFIARPLDNKLLEKKLYSIRSSTGNKIIKKKNALREVLRSLKNKEEVGVLLDQNTQREEGVFVDFFNRLACTSSVLALLALRTKAAIIPIFTVREGLDRHKIFLGKEIELTQTGNLEDDLRINTSKFTQVIESYVRKYPEQWFWMHRRWKTQPLLLENHTAN